MYMYILHIETSTGICSVALSQGRQILACHDMEEGMNHTAMLAPAIEAMMKEAALAPADLSAIAVSSGPGSYTGLRVGSSTVKAMAYSLGKPLLAVDTLKALAKAAFDKHPEAEFALPMIDARRKEVYAALFDRSLYEIWPVSSVILDEEFFLKGLPPSGKIIAVGDGSVKIGDLALLVPDLVVDPGIRCSARYLVPLAMDLFEKETFENPLHFVPYYHKPPNITEPKRAGMQGL